MASNALVDATVDISKREVRIYQQTTPDLWPVGPLCIDQAFHITFIAIVSLLIGRVI
jgi:hypothetical protein